MPNASRCHQAYQYLFSNPHFSDGSTAVPGVTWGSNGHLYFVNGTNPVTVQGSSPGNTVLMASTYYGGIFYNSNSISITVT